MIVAHDVIRIMLSPAQATVCLGNARIADFQPASLHDQSRPNLEHQLTGQLGQAAFMIAAHPEGFAVYQALRQEMNQNRYAGDGGTDYPPGRIDVKSTRIRRDIPLSSYHLIVRPRDYHADWVYVLALIRYADSLLSGAAEIVTVFLMGWATERMLGAPIENGTHSGTYYSLPVVDLHPLIPFRWGLEIAG